MLTPQQIRAARGLLNWSQRELAEASGVALQSIKNIETGKTDPRLSTATALRHTLESKGVIFIDQNGGGPGVRLRGR
ncbi:helix-turn-helix transcriptional regulator [Mesorhizobium sp. Root552]|jgi:DNA-binding XRE family transcriptional regulator|uniref:helix-turn-helix transcriptional regulator n=1 Tax=Mesorhizobium sp. Root552 TaxID=1736555 RepID=UPI0009E7EE27|nr:helix-turn-helix transcriptional regulator [Mesorhizobium sp. Root552]